MTIKEKLENKDVIFVDIMDNVITEKFTEDEHYGNGKRGYQKAKAVAMNYEYSPEQDWYEITVNNSTDDGFVFANYLTGLKAEQTIDTILAVLFYIGRIDSKRVCDYIRNSKCDNSDLSKILSAISDKLAKEGGMKWSD